MLLTLLENKLAEQLLIPFTNPSCIKLFSF